MFLQATCNQLINAALFSTRVASSEQYIASLKHANGWSHTNLFFWMEICLKQHSQGEQPFPPLHPLNESTSISRPFSYWSINCSAKHSALRYSSWREDVSHAAEFQGQMGCRDVIEIKLVGWVAGTGRVETHWGDTQNTQGYRQWR